MALALGARHRPAPEDERLAKSAASGANAVGAAGVSVAACAAAGAAGTSVLGLSGLPLGSAMGSASAVLGTVAASASVVGVVGTPSPAGEMLGDFFLVSFLDLKRNNYRFLLMIVGALNCIGLLDMIMNIIGVMYVFSDDFGTLCYRIYLFAYCILT